MVAQKEVSKGEVIQELDRLWGPLNEEQQKLLASSMTFHKYKKNEILYKDSESPDQLMFLIFGKVKIYKDGIGGRNQILRVIKPSECFAYRAFFANEDYKTAGSALEPCMVALIPMTTVVNILKKNYNLSIFFIRHLSKELGASDDRTVNLTQKHIRGRLAEALIFLRDSYGLEEDGSTLSIYLSREDLANLSNMTTSNAIRTLSAFANEKLIAIDGRKIKLMNEQELQRISELG